MSSVQVLSDRGGMDVMETGGWHGGAVVSIVGDDGTAPWGVKKCV